MEIFELDGRKGYIQRAMAAPSRRSAHGEHPKQHVSRTQMRGDIIPSLKDAGCYRKSLLSLVNRDVVPGTQKGRLRGKRRALVAGVLASSGIHPALDTWHTRLPRTRDPEWAIRRISHVQARGESTILRTAFSSNQTPSRYAGIHASSAEVVTISCLAVAGEHYGVVLQICLPVVVVQQVVLRCAGFVAREGGSHTGRYARQENKGSPFWDAKQREAT